jgi:DNA-binding NarL/FixJ family response regulator
VIGPHPETINPTVIRILVVDDHPLMRVGISTFLSAQRDMNVVAQAGTGQEALDLFHRHSPDVTIVDLKLPDISGIELISSLRKLGRDPHIVVLTNFEGDEDIHRALDAGAQGYVIKGMRQEAVAEAVRRVHRGKRFLPSPILQTLQSRPPNTALTPREREVLGLVVAGMSNREIGKQLGITVPTVKRHIGSILLRMDVKDRTQAVVAALRRGLVRL